jgi:hypothetical protein
VGVATVAALILGKHDSFFEINTGFVAHCLNFLTVGWLNPTKISDFRRMYVSFPP